MNSRHAVYPRESLPTPTDHVWTPHDGLPGKERRHAPCRYCGWGAQASHHRRARAAEVKPAVSAWDLLGIAPEQPTVLPATDITLDRARAKLSGLHFAKECLTPGELEILYIAEGLLRLIDERGYAR